MDGSGGKQGRNESKKRKKYVGGEVTPHISRNCPTAKNKKHASASPRPLHFCCGLGAVSRFWTTNDMDLVPFDFSRHAKCRWIWHLHVEYRFSLTENVWFCHAFACSVRARGGCTAAAVDEMCVASLKPPPGCCQSVDVQSIHARPSSREIDWHQQRHSRTEGLSSLSRCT